MVCRWEQELLVYNFTIANRSNKMMVDLDALTRRFGNLISNHISTNALLSSHDRYKRPHTYAATEFRNLGNFKIKETDNPSRYPPPFFTSESLQLFFQDITTNSATDSSFDPPSYPSITTLPIQMRPSPNICTISPLHDSVPYMNLSHGVSY